MARFGRNSQILGLIAVLLFGLGTLSACRDKPDVPVVVGTNIWLGYEAGYVAQKRKLFGDAEVDFRQFRSSTEVLRAFRNQALDVAALTLDEALTLQQNGIPIKVFLVVDVSNGADAIMARPGIASVRELTGERVAVENSGLGAYVLGRALQINGLRESDVIQNSTTADEMLDHYKSQRVDAVVTYEPFKSQLIRQGARKIFDSREIPDEIFDVLVARADFAKAHPAALRALAQGWLAGAHLVRQGQPAVLKEMSGRLEMGEQELRDALKEITIPNLTENRALLSGASSPIAQAANKLIPMLEKRNGTRTNFTPADITAPGLLPDDGQP